MSRDSATVSNNMRKIHSKDTSIELLLRKALWHKGYRYRKNYKALPGSPDIVLTKYKIAIFCDSEFFHGKDWDVLKPQLERGNNGSFWIKKIARNMERDDEVNKALLFRGWTVIRFWGKDIMRYNIGVWYSKEKIKKSKENINKLYQPRKIVTGRTLTIK